MCKTTKYLVAVTGIGGAAALGIVVYRYMQHRKLKDEQHELMRDIFRDLLRKSVDDVEDVE